MDGRVKPGHDMIYGLKYPYVMAGLRAGHPSRSGASRMAFVPHSGLHWSR
jgi:hypothetical protein